MSNSSSTDERKNRPGDIRITPIDLWVVLYFVYVVVPITPYVLPQKIRYLFMMGLVVLTIYILYRSEYIDIPIALIAAQAILFICLWVGKYSHVRDSSLINFLSRYLLFWSPMHVSLAIKKSGQDYQAIDHYIIKAGYLFTMLTTILGNIRYPEVSRLLAGQASTYQLDFFGRLNIGGYGFIYSIAIGMPILIHNALLKHNRFYERILDIILVLAGAFTLYISKYTTALLLCFLEIAMILLQRSKDKLTIIRVAAACIALVLILRKPIASLILLLTEYLSVNGNELMANRLYGIYCIFAGIQTSGDLASRIRLYSKSLDVFFKSPLWGNVIGIFHSLGGHSEFFDLLGGSGIIGLLSFLKLLIFGLKNAISRISDNDIFMYYSLLAAFIFFFCFDTVFTSLEVSFTLFAMPAFFLFKEEEVSDQT